MNTNITKAFANRLYETYLSNYEFQTFCSISIALVSGFYPLVFFYFICLYFLVKLNFVSRFIMTNGVMLFKVGSRLLLHFNIILALLLLPIIVAF